MDLDFKEPSLELKYLMDEAKRLNKKENLREYLVKKSNLEIYKKCIEDRILNYNEDDIKIIKESIKAIVEKLEAEKANETEYDQNIFENNKQIAEFYAQIMDLDNFEKSLESLNGPWELSPSLKMDIYMCKIRISMINLDYNSMEKNVNEASLLFDETCDWDRKNRFKIYKGLYFLMNGKFCEAANLFYEGIASFDATEMFSFDKLIQYYIFCGLISLSRKDIQEKILKNSDVVKCKKYIRLVKIYYECDYANFFEAILEFVDIISEDAFIKHYDNYFCREMKILGYNQLLTSYLSIDIEQMANVFKILPDALEADLRYFIAENRLPCLIDKVNGVVLIVKKNKMDCVSEILNGGETVLTLIKKELK